MAEHQRDTSVLRRIYEEILPLFHQAARGEWAWFENRYLAGMSVPAADGGASCPPRLQGRVRCWQVVQDRDTETPGCLPIACQECGVWREARPSLVEELGEAFNSLMYRLGKLDHSLNRAADLARDLASQWEMLEVENQVIRQTMTRDALTGLYNRQQLDLDLAEVMEWTGRRFRPVSVAMFDIDHFKDFNDTYGHPQGDKVLAACGRILEETTRQEDRCYRYGGEEFLVLFLDTPLPVAQGIADRLRRRFARLTFSVPGDHGETVRVSKTISGGLAQLQPGMDAETLLAAVDNALYTAKREGRNRVVVAHAADGAKTAADCPPEPLPVTDG